MNTKFFKFILGSGCFLSLIVAYDTSLNAQEPSIIDVLMRIQPAIVAIEAETWDMHPTNKQGAALDPKTNRIVLFKRIRTRSSKQSGAGVVIHPAGIIATNAHTIIKANRITVILNERTRTPAQLIGYLGPIDLAFLKINPPFPLARVSLANSDLLNLGDKIFNVGNSNFLKQTITQGTIRGMGSITPLGGEKIDLIQTSMNLYGGDSGGPLFDSHGQLIGIMTAKEMGSERSSFAIPSNKILSFLKEYLAKESKQP